MNVILDVKKGIKKNIYSSMCSSFISPRVPYRGTQPAQPAIHSIVNVVCHIVILRNLLGCCTTRIG